MTKTIRSFSTTPSPSSDESLSELLDPDDDDDDEEEEDEEEFDEDEYDDEDDDTRVRLLRSLLDGVDWGCGWEGLDVTVDAGSCLYTITSSPSSID
jgi:hypothetical protein